MPLPRPDRAWERVSTDIFTFDNQDFLVLINAYSLWIELFSLNRKNTSEVISKMKNSFARYGVPDIIYSDNVPFNSSEIKIAKQ